MKKLLLILMLFICCACSNQEPVVYEFMRVSENEALEMMQTMDDYIILDVREPNEFGTLRIEGAINIPVGTIDESVIETLPNKDQTIFVYCRSGNRSLTASQKLYDLGYTNIIEMGGLLDWEGPTFPN